MSVPNHRKAFRPLRGGTQLFQPATNEAGTLGAFLTSDGVDRWLLTCLHVIARTNGAVVATDMLHQPDRGSSPIATLGNTVVDTRLDCAAVRLLIPSADEIIGIGRLAAPKPPQIGMNLIKSGWKTGVSEGFVQNIVGDDVIIARRKSYPSDYLLASTGDSGAVWVESGTLAPVALHKRESGGGIHLAHATAFHSVLAALNLLPV